MSPTETIAIERMQHSQGRVRLDPLEALIWQYERQCLSETRGARYQPAIEKEAVPHVWYSPDGTMGVTHETFWKQKTDYIHHYIRQQLKHSRVNLTLKQIDWYLNRVITPIFETAEARYGRTPFGLPKYRGVTYNKQKRRWQAQKRVGNKVRFLGYHDSPEAAHAAYQRAC